MDRFDENDGLDKFLADGLGFKVIVCGCVPGGVGFLMDISARYGTEKIRNLIRNIDWLLLTCDNPGFAENYRKLMGTHLSKRLIIPSKGSVASGCKKPVLR